MDAHPAGRGDGILIGSEKQELPSISPTLMADTPGDVLPGVAMRGVFHPVGENGDDYLARPIRFRSGSEFGSQFVDRAADRVQQRRAATGDEGAGVQLDHFRDGQRLHRDFVLIIKEHQREPRAAGFLLLFAEQAVEAADGGLNHGFHGTRAIKNKGDFSEVVVHCLAIMTAGVGQM